MGSYNSIDILFSRSLIYFAGRDKVEFLVVPIVVVIRLQSSCFTGTIGNDVQSPMGIKLGDNFVKAIPQTSGIRVGRR
jgi:hypothetical protein